MLFITNRYARSLVKIGMATASIWAAGIAQADVTATYEAGGSDLFEVAIPDNWIVSVGGFRDLDASAVDKGTVPRVMGIYPESDRRVWVGLTSPDGVSTFSQAKDYILQLDKRLVENPVLEGPKSTTIGGRSARTITGTGIRNGNAVNFTILAIDLPGNRVAIGVVVGENGARGLYRDDLTNLIRSFNVVR
ncbi:MAG: hypothetical protein ABJO67_19255 [Pseudoruegeria sp.]